MKKTNRACYGLFLAPLLLFLATCAGSLEINSLVIAPTDSSTPAGTTKQFTATGFLNDGSSRDITNEVTWTSSNTFVATVNSSGLVTGINPGSTTITATSSLKSSAPNVGTTSTTFTVTSAVLSSISVSPANAVLPRQLSQSFKASGIYSDGSTIDITSQVNANSGWSSSDTTIATVNPATGVVTTMAAGATVISAAYGGISGGTPLTVSAAALNNIFVAPLNPSVPSIPPGITRQFTATGNYSDGSAFPITDQVTWTSSNPAAATIVDNTGLATIKAAGVTTITATSPWGVSGNTVLTANALPLVSITVNSPTAGQLGFGQIQQFTATGNYSDGITSMTSDITALATWSSDNPGVAAVTPGPGGGVVTAFGVGNATIQAAVGAVSGNIVVTVSSR